MIKAAVMTSAGQVTRLLKCWSQGPGGSRAAHVRGVCRTASSGRRQMARERPDHTLQVTALIHEAYLRLLDVRKSTRRTSSFLSPFGTDHATHPGGRSPGKALSRSLEVPLQEELLILSEPRADLVALDDALKSLAGVDPRRSEVVELRFFGGLTVEETAEALRLSPRRIMRQSSLAHAWPTGN